MSSKRTPTELRSDQSAPGANGADKLHALIRNCAEIPIQVREAKLARIDERLIDDSMIRFLTDHRALEHHGETQAGILQRRLDALSPYVGQTLVCVLIVLPGVSYTIEIDLALERIVHWEWQAA